MPTICIKRSSEWANKARKIEIYIDNVKNGTIDDGETKIFELEQGSHEVFAKIDWCRSQKLVIHSNENTTTVLKLSGFKYGKFIVPASFLVLLVYFLGKFDFLNVSSTFLLGLVIAFFLFLIYFITFGKNRYLRLSEK